MFEVDAELPEILLDSILEYLNLRPLLLVVHRLYLQHLFGLLAALVVGLHDLLDLTLLKQLLAHLLILGPQAIEFTLLVFMLLLLLLPFHLDFVNLCHEELVVRLERGDSLVKDVVFEDELGALVARGEGRRWSGRTIVCLLVGEAEGEVVLMSPFHILVT